MKIDKIDPRALKGERLELHYVPLDQAVLWDENPKAHDIGSLCQAIRRYGFQDPPKFDATLGALVYGNGRSQALQMMRQQKEHPPRGILSDERGHWYMPIKFGLDLESQSVARAFALDHNNLTMAGGEYSPLDMARMWDSGQYTAMLARQAEDNELPITVDYDDLDLISAYTRDQAEGAGSGESEDKALATPPEELREKWGVEPGQLWVIPSETTAGAHRVMVGDATRGEDVAALLDGARAQGCVTSPPYAAQRKQVYGGPNPEYYLDWWQPIQAHIRDALTPDGCFFLNLKAHSDDGERLVYVMELVVAMKRQWGWSFVDELCWLKDAVPGMFKYRFRNGFEPVYHFAATPREFKFRPENVMNVSDEVPIPRGPGSGSTSWSKLQGSGEQYFPKGLTEGLARPNNVISQAHYEPARGHPAVYPYEIPQFFIRAFSDERDAWLDPFVGTGSTLVAAERNARLGYGLDLKPEYVGVTLERLAEMGLEPELVTR